MRILTIADAFPAIIRKANISKREFISYLGVDSSTFSRYINHKREPDKSIYDLVISFIKINNLGDIWSLFELDGPYLWHGSKTQIEGKVTTNKNPRKNNGNDFGDGFYLGESFKQASSYVSDYPDPTIYRFRKDQIDLGKPLVLSDKEKDIINWVLIIGYNRRKIDKEYASIVGYYVDSLIKGKDSIIGKIADAINFSVMDEFFSNEHDVDQIVLTFSLSDLGNQYVLINDSLASKLDTSDCFKLSKTLREYMSKERMLEREKYKNSASLILSRPSKENRRFKDIVKQYVISAINK